MDVCTWITTGRLNGIDETYVDEPPIILCAYTLKRTSATPDEYKKNERKWNKQTHIEVSNHLCVQFSQAY